MTNPVGYKPAGGTLIEDLVRIRAVSLPGGTVLVARTPVIGIVRTEKDEDDTPRLYYFDHPILGHVYSETRAGLESVGHEHVSVLWCAYVRADEKTLAPCAQQLRVRLLDAFREQDELDAELDPVPDGA